MVISWLTEKQWVFLYSRVCWVCELSPLYLKQSSSGRYPNILELLVHIFKRDASDTLVLKKKLKEQENIFLQRELQSTGLEWLD